MSVLELRQECREKCSQLGHPSSWTAQAKESECRIYLTTGIPPAWANKQAATSSAEEFAKSCREVPAAVVPAESKPAAADNLAAAIAAAVGQYIKPEAAAVDETAVRRIVAEAMAESKPAEHRIVVQLPSGETKTSKRQHELFPLLLAALSCRIPCWLAGPAGSGKTSAASAAAEALKLPFYAESFCAETPASKLLGYMSATGEYVSTDFRRAYENGGVFCFDEIDNADPNVLAVLNSALANGHCSFADKSVERHADFVPVAGANTFGQGGNRQYTRNQIDAATLDRFFMIAWGYDSGLEASFLGIDEPASYRDIADGGVPESAEDWLNTVRAYRYAVEEHNLRMVVSPRATIYGYKLAEAGVGKIWLLAGLVFKGCDPATRVKLAESAAGAMKTLKRA